MPMLDAYIPEGALTPEAERKLLATCTDLLLEHEGARPTNARARSLAWVFVHRHETYVAGAPAQAPYYKFVCQVPEGQYDEQRRMAVTRAMTQALVEAEGGRWPDPQGRVWGCSPSRCRMARGAVSAGAWSPCRTSLSSSSGAPVAATANSAWPSGVAGRRARCSRPPRPSSQHGPDAAGLSAASGRECPTPLPLVVGGLGR